MGLKLKLILFIAGIIIFLFVIGFLRKNRLRASFSILWIGVSLFLISIPVFEPFYKWLSVNVIGIQDARTIIYMVIIVFLLIYNFYLTLKINQISDQTQHLISSTAIFESELKQKIQD